MKICKQCNINKSIGEFPKRNNSLDGCRNICKVCTNYNMKIRYHNNENVKEQERCRNKEYYNKNKDLIKQKTKLYKRQSRRKLDIRLRDNLRNRLNQAIKKNQKTGSAVQDLGCSIADFKNHIESLWQDGMSWDNWARDGWHIDHIQPLASFDLINPEEFKKACHHSNLQPLWAEDNWSK